VTSVLKPQHCKFGSWATSKFGIGMTKNRALKIFVWFLTLFLLAAAMRRMLLQAARSIEQGIDPPGTGTEYYNLRAIDKVLLPGVV